MVRNVQTCPECHGTGKVIKEKCTSCRGTGYTSSRKKIQVSVPAGIDNGQSIRIREKGEPGTNGGPRGDLLVEVNVARHPIFQRQDMNIFSTAPITYAQAALGGEVRISTVDGEVAYHPIFQRQDMNIFSTAPITYAQAALGGEVRISTVDGEVAYEVKPGTQTDTRIRLKGKGVPSLRNKNVRGDHYVTLVVQVPTNLNAEAKEALRKFDEACGNLKGKGVPSLRNKNVRGDHYVTLVVQVPTNLNAEAKEALRKFDEACGNRPSGTKGEAGEKQEKPEKKKKSFMDKLKETFEE